jgi:hypothetical protein
MLSNEKVFSVMSVLISTREVSLFVILLLTVLTAAPAMGQAPPELTTVFPSGGQLGHSVDVTVSGRHLQTLRTLHSNVPGVRCERLDADHYRLSIPSDVMPGLYDLWAVGDNGVSAPRVLAIGNRTELIEAEPNETESAAMSVPLDVVINGRIEKVNDIDHFRFDAKRGQRVVVECSAERIDSRLRAILEIYDVNGRRLAVNRGYLGSDPLIDFRAPADGSYVVRIQDLISSGSVEHYYRLEIDTRPRVAFSLPSVIERGKAGRVTLYGWNLSATGSTENFLLDRVDVEIPASLAHESWPLPVRLLPSQSVLEGAAFPFHLPGSHAPVVIGLSDVPVVVEPVVVNAGDNGSAAAAQEIVVPCEISGQLAGGDECDWFAIQAQRGEVFFIEALGQRIQSPVDLQISVLSRTGFQPVSSTAQLDAQQGRASNRQDANPKHTQQVLAQFTDETRNIGGAFPTGHLDPAGRWTCPADGRYLIAIRNLIGGLQPDERRTYRLSVRREEPAFELVAVSGRADPAGLNVKRGGREVLDLLAFRRRGMNDAICVSARDLPLGVDCPDVWLGPGVNHATIVVSADRNATLGLGELKLVGSAGLGLSPVFSEGVPASRRAPTTAVRGGTIVRAGSPNGWGRITSKIPLAIAGDSPLKITADGDEELVHPLYGRLRVKHSPGGVLDVAVHVERKDIGHQAVVKLIGVGLPESIQNQTATIPAGQQKGYVSFYLPPSLPVGRYSFVVRAETTVPTVGQKTETVVVHSNPVVFDVQPAAFLVEVDPFALTQAVRGETITVAYSANRLNGFIGKMHTELAAPGRVTDVVGLRGRGETFTGQTEKGTLQIVINDDAPLGRQPFLRLFTVGVVEDQATYFGSSLLPMEIIERTK